MKLILLALTITTALGAPSIKITHGEDAKRGQFPYQVSYQWGLFNIWQHACGGSILSPTWILTAGHCVTQVPTIGQFKIVAGILDLTDEVAERQERKVIKKIVHSNYGGAVGPNDIALLQLEKPLELSDYVQPISLPEAGVEISGNTVLSGWGSVSTGYLPLMPNTLQTVNIPVLTQDECNNAIEQLLGENEENPYDNKSNICTGPLTDGISACSGDSGGPLAQDGIVVGIVSWGMLPCGSQGAPSVYTNVSNFIEFIKSNVDDLKRV